MRLAALSAYDLLHCQLDNKEGHMHHVSETLISQAKISFRCESDADVLILIEWFKKTLHLDYRMRLVSHVLTVSALQVFGAEVR